MSRSFDIITQNLAIKIAITKLSNQTLGHKSLLAVNDLNDLQI